MLQQDWHAALGVQLLRAELAPSPLERLLAVTRLLLCLATAPLAPSPLRGYPDTPVAVLGQHYLSRRVLGGCLSACLGCCMA